MVSRPVVVIGITKLKSLPRKLKGNTKAPLTSPCFSRIAACHRPSTSVVPVSTRGRKANNSRWQTVT